MRHTYSFKFHCHLVYEWNHLFITQPECRSRYSDYLPAGRFGDQIPAETNQFLPKRPDHPASLSTALRFIFRQLSYRGEKVTTRLSLAPRLRISGVLLFFLHTHLKRGQGENCLSYCSIVPNSYICYFHLQQFPTFQTWGSHGVFLDVKTCRTGK